jgi:hypothetical protein
MVFRRKRTGDREILRMSTVGFRVGIVIVHRSVHVLRLKGCGSHMPLVHGNALVCRRRVVDSTRSTAEGYVAVVDDRIALHNRAVDIGIVNHGGVHAHDCCVVDKIVAPPDASSKADAHVTESIVHATVVAHMRSPIAGVP